MDIGFAAQPSLPRMAQVRRLHRVLYPAGLRMQQAMAEFVKDETHPDQILILEHDPVFTLGRNATRADIHVSDAFLSAQGVSVFETDRGGQVTYHGPGQIVAYPICALRGPRQDLGRFVRGLEEVMIRTAGDFGVRARRLDGYPGIWVETERGLEKLGALGVHLKRWITTHGLAFNVAPNLDHFRWITPCGITDKGVCSLASLLGSGAPSWDEAATRLEHHLIEVLALDLQPSHPISQSISALTWRRGTNGIQILMMLRQPDQGLWWSSVTGMLEPGESLEEGARREAQEETGLEGALKPLGFSHTFWLDPSILGLPPGEPRFNTETCFHLEVAGDAQVQLDLKEHSQYRWCSIEEARELMRWEGSKAALELLAQQLL